MESSEIEFLERKHLSNDQYNRNGRFLSGTEVHCIDGAVCMVRFDITLPFSIKKSRFCGQVKIQPSSVRIQRSADEVFRAVLDFPKYEVWNPFHRRVELFEKDGMKCLQMSVNLVKEPSTELDPNACVKLQARIIYLDCKRHIFLFSRETIHGDSLRGQWIESTNESECVYHSFDVIAGLSVPVVKYYLLPKIMSGFYAQHLALKGYCEGKV